MDDSQDDNQKTPRAVQKMEYAGFWKRVVASLIDTLIVVIFTLPLLWAFYGSAYFSSDKAVHGLADALIYYVLPAVFVIVFWRYKSATPGKMVISARIVDATTGGPPSTGQLIGRYFGYFVSIIPLCLGLLWVGLDKRKQGWHDKLANTVVIYNDD
ncbi:MAG: RDD family protein [Betaproteobacteria bacterium]